MAPINVGLSPNTEPDDVRLAFRLLFQPSTFKPGATMRALEQEFEKKMGVQNAVAFRSGRSGLYAALSAMELKPGDEVIVQSFTCVVVPNAVIWAGGTPIYADVNDDFNMSVHDLEGKISPKTRGLIIQHTFGFPADLEKILELAKRHRLIVIEDCAHALGAEYRGGKAGTFGDISMWSFGRDKIISSVFGGMVTVKNPELAKKIKALRDHSSVPRKTWVMRQLLHPVLLNWFVLPTYNLKIGKMLLELFKRAGVISKAVYASEKSGQKKEEILGQMPDALAALALHQLEKLEKLNAHRETIARLYDEGLQVLQGADFLLPQRDPHSRPVYLRYVVKTGMARELIAKARAWNIILDDWYNPSIAPAGVRTESVHYRPESCPNAERLSKLSLNLPTGINTSGKDAERIIEFLKKNVHGN